MVNITSQEPGITRYANGAALIDVEEKWGKSSPSGFDERDPASLIPGMPPGFGNDVLPHVFSFQGIVSNMAKVYKVSDEALQDSWQHARFMLNDPMVTECVEQRMRSSALLDFHIEPDDEKDSRQKEIVDEATRQIKLIPRFMQYRESLMRGIWFGRYANKHRWSWRSIRGQQRIVLSRWEPLHGDKLVFRFDDGSGQYNPDQVGIRVGAGFRLGQRVSNRWEVEKINKYAPTDQGMAYFLEPWQRPLIAIHKHMIEDGEYDTPENAGRIHGVGIRSRIYWTWHQKQECLSWLMEFLERSAMGIEIWTYPMGNKTAKAQTKKAAEERIGEGRNVILVPKPGGEESTLYGYERIEPAMGGAETLKSIIIEFFGHQIKRYILGQTLTTEAAGTGLGSNLASVHLDTYMQIVRYDATNLEETITTDLLEPLIRFNWPKFADVPFRFKIDVEAPDVEAKLEAYKNAYEMGCRIKEKDVMDMIGASAPTESDYVLQDPSKQAESAARQAGGDGASTFSMSTSGEAAAIWAALQKTREAEALGSALRKPYGSEDSERQRLATYAAGNERDRLAALKESLKQAVIDTDPDPSVAQREAGNYRKGSFSIHGLSIALETPRWTWRRGTDADGTPWQVKMPAHYGYIRKTLSEADGDHVDVFIGPELDSELVFVIDQKRAGEPRFDEHKVMLGFKSAAAAKEAYLSSYSGDYGKQIFAGMTPMTLDQFRAWLAANDTARPVSRDAQALQPPGPPAENIRRERTIGKGSLINA